MSDPVPLPSPGTPLLYGEPGNPIVVVVHDWFGRLPWLESFGEALASRGLRVAIPDLYDGESTSIEAEAERLMRELSASSAEAEIESAIAQARGEGSARVGMVGFSMGGWLALRHAQQGTADAVVAYSATLGPDEHGVIPAPVLLHFAEVDEWSTGAEPESFVSRLKEHGTPVAQHTYIATLHSFANSSVRATSSADAAALAYARTAAFLEQHLID